MLFLKAQENWSRSELKAAKCNWILITFPISSFLQLTWSHAILRCKLCAPLIENRGISNHVLPHSQLAPLFSNAYMFASTGTQVVLEMPRWRWLAVFTFFPARSSPPPPYMYNQCFDSQHCLLEQTDVNKRVFLPSLVCCQSVPSWGISL